MNPRLDKSGRAVPVGPEFQLGRAVQAQIFCGPSRFLPIFREDFANIRLFFERTILNFKWVINKVQIFIEKSFKNTYRNKIEHDRPEISAGPGQAVQSGPKIYNPGSKYRIYALEWSFAQLSKNWPSFSNQQKVMTRNSLRVTQIRGLGVFWNVSWNVLFLKFSYHVCTWSRGPDEPDIVPDSEAL